MKIQQHGARINEWKSLPMLSWMTNPLNKAKLWIPSLQVHLGDLSIAILGDLSNASLPKITPKANLMVGLPKLA